MYKSTRKIRRNHNFAKLNRIQVILIKQILKKRFRPTYAKIGEQFGVSHSTISRIASGKIWKDVKDVNQN